MSALIDTISEKLIILSLLNVYFLVSITLPNQLIARPSNLSNKHLVKFQNQIDFFLNCVYFFYRINDNNQIKV